ncbi:MAG: DUF2505 domain-containing protein [Candidatus Nanopelagicales bacterium]|jgi:hypothetical protein|nr:DUF2505 domain-containing protein [Candidatus Nanopelagicales bacterium]
MAKRYHGTMHFDVAPDVVFAAQADPSYVAWKHEQMAAFDISANASEDGSGWTISSSRKLPAQLPSAAKRFVGEHIQVDEVHRWGHPEVDGTRRGTVTASFGGAPMAVDGTLVLRPEGMGAVLDVVIHSRASVPLVGGKLEAIVGEQFMRALRKEQQIAPEWFAE